MTEEQFTEAAALFRAAKYYDAVRAYARLAESEDASTEDRVRALNNISACYASTKEYGKSLESAERALELLPSNAKAMSRAATAHEGLRHYEEAAKYYALALQTEKDSATCAAGLARVQALSVQKPPAARAESKDDYYYAKSLRCGKESMTAGNYLEAIRHYTKALDLFSQTHKDSSDDSLDGRAQEQRREQAVLYANRSAAHLRAGLTEQSADDALLATQLDSGYARGFYRLACAKHKLKKYNDCYDALVACLALEPEHAEGKALLTDVKPIVAKSRMSASERAAADAEKIAQLQEKQIEEKAEAVAKLAPAVSHAHATRYVYCTFCNESGHTRAECPMRRKRPRD